MEYGFSSQQQAVVDWVRNGSGSAFVEAVAGSGKTTTLIGAIKETSGSVAFVAYNKKIADEAKGKIARLNLGNRVQAGTFHSFGLRGWRYVHKGVEAGPEAARKKVDMVAAHMKSLKIVPEDDFQRVDGFATKLIALAKQRAIGLFGSVQDDSLWYDIIDHFDLAYEIEDTNLIEAGVELAQRGLRYSCDIASDIIDFDDMIYMPVVSGIRLWENDWVLTDEGQDTNPARRALARKILKRNGRSVWVGDRHQAIYGFCHPAGTPVLTANGWQPIEQLEQGSPTVVFSTSGDASGWAGGNAVQDTTTHEGWYKVLRLHAGSRHVDLTPHHRIPAKIEPNPCYYTYVMERVGTYRVGHCASHAMAGIGERRWMLSQRCKTEGANKAWLLASYATKREAERAEQRLIARGVSGITFHDKNDEQVEGLGTTQSELAALEILREHGRMKEYPIWRCDRRHHFEVNLPFLTEACNLLPGMRVQVLGDWDPRKRGRSRHTGEWLPVTIDEVANDSGTTYGITVKPIAARAGYQNWPLYAAGEGGGIIVHNTGADNDAIDQIVRDFRCQMFPLTVTYRCPKAVVNEARLIVSHIEAADTAPVGDVSVVKIEDLENIARTAEGFFHPTNDAILCRKTAPLVKMAYDLIRSGIACHVEGKDIGIGLLNLVNRWRVRTIDGLEDRLEAHLVRETEKLMAKGRETQAEALADRIETIRVMMDGCPDVDCVRQKIAKMFLDSNDEQRPTLTLSTYHKSKGREWQRVFLLGHHQFTPSPWARQQWQIDQEFNCQYVAITRSQGSLVYVDMPVKAAA